MSTNIPYAENQAETYLNKTVTLASNIVNDTSIAVGDVVHSSDGVKFTRFARGTANQILAVNAAGTDIAYRTLFTKGINTQSGTGAATSFTIPHGLGVIPTGISFDPGSSAASAASWVSAIDATNITVTFSVAPANAANNLTWYWTAFV